jgi:hypothetical protein
LGATFVYVTVYLKYLIQPLILMIIIAKNSGVVVFHVASRCFFF